MAATAGPAMKPTAVQGRLDFRISVAGRVASVTTERRAGAAPSTEVTATRESPAQQAPKARGPVRSARSARAATPAPQGIPASPVCLGRAAAAVAAFAEGTCAVG